MINPLQPSTTAPDFTLLDQDNNTHKLSDYKGKWVLIYFYPKDDTPGCTTQACGLRDSIEEYTQAGITILGISKDSVKSHKKFQEKTQSPFYSSSRHRSRSCKKLRSLGSKEIYGQRIFRHAQNIVFN